MDVALATHKHGNDIKTDFRERSLAGIGGARSVAIAMEPKGETPQSP